ncbi:hypothetical protein D9M73_129800 [compost metagenome]
MLPITIVGARGTASGASAASTPNSSTAPAAKTRPRLRVAIPRSISPSSASTASASPAALTHPASTSAQFCVCNPAKIKSPRLGWPTVVDKVAAPIVHTAAVRTPAISTGATNGASTKRSFCHAVMPMPSAASITAGSIPASPVTPLRRIGSSA